MAKGKVLKRKTSGCCWRKLLEKTLTREENLPGRSNKFHQCFDQDEIVYLNLYLTSLERKMEAIEEITRMKWYQKQMRNSVDTQNFIRSGFKYCQKGASGPLVTTTHNYTNGLRTACASPQKHSVLRGSSEAIIREILSLGSDCHFQSYTSRKCSALPAPKLDAIITEPDKTAESHIVTVGELTADRRPQPEAIAYSSPAHLLVSSYVAAKSYPIEEHVAIHKEELRVLELMKNVKASCTIEFFDIEEETIEITYSNRDWDKKGTIVLRDIKNQIGAQTELIGRVVCFLLGVTEVDLV